MRLILGLWLTIACVSPAVAQSNIVERDANGNRTGTISQQGSRDVVRDKNGNAQSYYQRQGNEIVHRDMNGNRLGSASKQ